MRETLVSLTNMNKVKNFVSITSKFDAGIDLVSGRYVVDAKSIMGIFSVDLSKPIMVRIHEDGEEAEKILNALGKYVIEKAD